MEKYEHNLTANSSGALRPLSGAFVTVTDNATGIPAALFEDDELTLIPQPLTTDNTGYFGFKAADGKYTLTFSGPRFKTFTRQVLLEDPDDNPAVTAQELALQSGAGKVGFKQDAPGAVPRKVQDELRERVSVTQFGAKGDGVTDDHAAIQAAINACIATGKPWSIYFPPGTYYVSDELDFSAATTHHEFWCDRKMATIVPAPFGASKHLFKGGIGAGEPSIRGLTIGNDTADRNHPIGIYLPNDGRSRLSDITFNGYGNTAIWASRVFNSDWDNLNLFFCGTQPVHKSVPTTTTLSVTAGSTAATASAATFDASDVGKLIYVAYSGAQDNNAFPAVIAAVADGQNITLDRVSPITSAASRFSFTAVTGSIASGSKTFVADSDFFDPSDVGRFIYVDGAGANGGIMVSRVVTVNNSKNATFVDAAETTVANKQIYLTPTAYLGLYEASETVNDLVISSMNVEGFKGPGIIAHGGTQLYFNNLKTHGRTWREFNDFGRSSYSMIVSSVDRAVVTTWEHEFCGGPVNSGPIKVCGRKPQLSIGTLTVNAPLIGEYLAEFTPSDTNLSSLTIGDVLYQTDATKYKGLVYTSSIAQQHRLYGTGSVVAPGTMGAASLQLVGQFGAIRSGNPRFLNTDTITSFKPPTRSGQLFVTAEDSSSRSGCVHFNVQAGTCVVMYGGANFAAVGGVTPTGTTGAANFLTVFATNDGYLHIELRGGNRRLYFAIVG